MKNEIFNYVRKETIKYEKPDKLKTDTEAWIS